MDYREWLAKTNRGAFSIRSDHLRAVDAALKDYSAMKTPTNLVTLNNKLDDWQKSKDDWKASSRNLGGAVQELITFINQRMLYKEVLNQAASRAQERTALHESHPRHVLREVNQVQRGNPPQLYKWNVRFDMVKRGTVVEVVVHIKPVIGDVALLDDVKRFWSLHIQKAWNIATIVERGAHYDLQFRLNFTDSVTNAYRVNIVNPPPDIEAYVAARPAMKSADARAEWARTNTPHMEEWARVDSQAVIHEFGHMIGCPDEYWTTSHKGFGHFNDGFIYNNEPFTTDSIMNDTSSKGRIHDRHFKFVENQYNLWKRPNPAARIEIIPNSGYGRQRRSDF